MTVAVDAGTIINPQAFEGQLEGGMDQGVGYALREEYVIGKTTDYVSFKFPTIRDTFDIEMITRQTPRSNGPLGATGGRRNDDGLDRPGGDQCHLQRLRRKNIQPAGHA